MKLNMKYRVHLLIIRLRTFFGGVTYLEFWGHGQHMVTEWLALDLSAKVSIRLVMFQKSGYTSFLYETLPSYGTKKVSCSYSSHCLEQQLPTPKEHGWCPLSSSSRKPLRSSHLYCFVVLTVFIVSLKFVSCPESTGMGSHNKFASWWWCGAEDCPFLEWLSMGALWVTTTPVYLS